MTLPGVHIGAALQVFRLWFGSNPEIDVWGNGATFDNALVTAACDACQVIRPWGEFRDRCYRTVKNLWPDIPLIRSGTHHNALDDARDQATHLMTLLAPR